MLRTPTGAEKGNHVLSCALDSEQRAFETLVGAARATEQSLVLAELVLLVRGQPGGFERALCKNFGSVLDSLVRSYVRGIVRIVVSDDANSRFCRHEPRIEPE